ncbi:MAG: tRNA lysidine(34) synthetase TilS [Alphaproteobacteria bacterium]
MSKHKVPDCLFTDIKTPCAFMDRFCAVIEDHFPDRGLPEKVAVAVSGGADSMVLCHALLEYVAAYSPKTHVYVLSVDHRLRSEAADEVLFVGQQVGALPCSSHHILVWDGGAAQETRIEEQAREARYGLLFDFMAEHGIGHLFVGHHQNDQAETFLFRLAKGSGLDGLAGMSVLSEMSYEACDFVLCRPLLGEGKAEIEEYAALCSIPYIKDPSNDDERYARVRLRNSMEVLAAEGLSSKRLSVTAKRLERARNALDYYVDREYKNLLLSTDADRVVLDCKKLAGLPYEVVIRIVLKSMAVLHGEAGGYGPRLSRVEDLCHDLICSKKSFRKRTLGGVIFEKKNETGEFLLQLEV